MLLKLPAIETDELISVVLYHCDIIINSIGTPPEKLVVPEGGCDCSNVSLPLQEFLRLSLLRFRLSRTGNYTGCCIGKVSAEFILTSVNVPLLPTLMLLFAVIVDVGSLASVYSQSINRNRALRRRYFPFPIVTVPVPAVVLTTPVPEVNKSPPFIVKAVF